MPVHLTRVLQHIIEASAIDVVPQAPRGSAFLSRQPKGDKVPIRRMTA